MRAARRQPLGGVPPLSFFQSTLGRSGHTKSQRSCKRLSRLGQSPLSCSFHFIMLPLSSAEVGSVTGLRDEMELANKTDRVRTAD